MTEPIDSDVQEEVPEEQQDSLPAQASLPAAPEQEPVPLATEVTEEPPEAGPEPELQDAPRDTEEVVEDSPSDTPWQLLLERARTQEEALAVLHRDFHDRFAIDQHKQTQIDQLHRELQEHKRGLLAKAQRPLLSGLVRLHNALERMAETLLAEQAPAERETIPPTPPTIATERVQEILAGFQDDVEILLEDQGVQLFRVAQPHFDPHRQTVVQGISTAEEANVNRICRRVRPGFEQDGSVLQKERVEVYYRAPDTPETPHS